MIWQNKETEEIFSTDKMFIWCTQTMSTILHEMVYCYKTIVEICIATQQLLHHFIHRKHQISSKEGSSFDMRNSKWNPNPYLLP